MPQRQGERAPRGGAPGQLSPSDPYRGAGRRRSDPRALLACQRLAGRLERRPPGSQREGRGRPEPAGDAAEPPSPLTLPGGPGRARGPRIEAGIRGANDSPGARGNAARDSGVHSPVDGQVLGLGRAPTAAVCASRARCVLSALHTMWFCPQTYYPHDYASWTEKSQGGSERGTGPGSHSQFSRRTRILAQADLASKPVLDL